MGLLRMIFGLVGMARAEEKQRKLKRDLQGTYQADRAKADYASQDSRLKRDLEALERDNNESRS